MTNNTQVQTVIHYIISNFKMYTVALMAERVTTFLFSPTHSITALQTENNEL